MKRLMVLNELNRAVGVASKSITLGFGRKLLLTFESALGQTEQGPIVLT